MGGFLNGVAFSAPYIETVQAGTSFLIIANMGFTSFSVYNPAASSGNVTITSTAVASGQGVGNGIALVPGGTPYGWDNGGQLLDGITITCPAGTTALLSCK